MRGSGLLLRQVYVLLHVHRRRRHGNFVYHNGLCRVEFIDSRRGRRQVVVLLGEHVLAVVKCDRARLVGPIRRYIFGRGAVRVCGGMRATLVFGEAGLAAEAAGITYQRGAVRPGCRGYLPSLAHGLLADIGSTARVDPPMARQT